MMGEAAEHISYAVDHMVESWTLLLPPVETPPLPLKETFPATKKATVQVSQKVVAIIPSADTRLCHWCDKPFTPNRSNQIFCDPDKERKKNWERRKALVLALAAQFRAFGWRARDMVKVAQRCVDAAYEGVLKALRALGWEYGQKTKAWVYREKQSA